jgi:hypothetical protein
MRIANLANALLILSLTASSSAINGHKSLIRHLEAKEDRELITWGQTRCANQLAACQAAGITQLPYDEWMSTLAMLDGGDSGLYQDVRALVKTLSQVDFSGLEASAEIGAGALASTILDLQSALQEIHSLDAAAQGSDVSVDQVPMFALNIVAQAVQFITDTVQRVLGINLSFLNDITATAILAFSSLSKGPFVVAGIIISGLVTYLTPLVIQLLGKGSTQNTPSLCTSDLMGCQFSKLVITVVPALVGEAFISQGYTIEKVNGFTP